MSRDDYLCAIIAVQQCVELKCDAEQLRPFVSEALWPGVETIKSIELACPAPGRSLPDVSRAIHDLAENARSLNDLLNGYYAMYGTLPLATPRSMGDIVLEGLQRHKWNVDVWSTVWTWQQESRSVLAQYHACQIFCVSPDLVPKDQAVFLWQQVADVLRSGFADPATSIHWRIRCELARHFCQWLELQFPGNDSERVSTLSWRIAERLAVAIQGDEQLMNALLDSTLGEAGGIAGQMWELAHPPMQPSSLRYVTLFNRSMWASSLAVQLGRLLKADSAVASEILSPDGLQQTMVRELVTLEWNRENRRPDLAYAFEQNMTDTVGAWLSSDASCNRQDVVGDVMQQVSDLSDPNRLMERLRALPDVDEASATLASLALRAAAFRGDLPIDEFSKQLGDNEWRGKVLMSTKMPILQWIHEAIAEVVAQKDADWSSTVPHYYAIASLEAPSQELAELLFGLALGAAVTSQGTSAIRRILSSAKRQMYSKIASEWRERLKALQLQTSPWLSCRLRAAIAALYI